MSGIDGKKVAMLVGLEPSYGAGVALTAADAVPVSKVDPGFEVNVEELELLTQSEVPDGEEVTFTKQTLSIEIPFHGPGAALSLVNLPTWTRLMQICGWDVIDDIAGAGGFIIRPIAALSACSSAQIDLHIGASYRLRYLGTRGTVNLQGPEVGKPARWAFQVQGFYSTPAPAAPPAGIALGSIRPPPFLGSLSYAGGFQPCLKSMDLKFGPSLIDELCFAAVSTNGLEEIRPDQWEPVIDFTARLDAIATRNWVANMEANTEAAWDMTIGTQVGNRLDVNMPRLKKTALAYDRGTIVKANISAKMKNNALGDSPPTFCEMRLY